MSHLTANITTPRENNIVMFGNKYKREIEPIIVRNITNILLCTWIVKCFVFTLN